MRYLAGIIMVLICGFIWGYQVGQSRRIMEQQTKEVEIVKTKAHRQAVIHSRPHITRDLALERMRANKL